MKSIPAALVTCLLVHAAVAAGPSGAAGEPVTEDPLPRYRLAPDGGIGTPERDPGQSRVPRAIDVARADLRPDACTLASPPEYAAVDGVLYRYGFGQWEPVVTDLVASLTGDPTRDEIAWVVVGSASEQSQAEADFFAAGADLTKVEFLLEPSNSIWIRDYGPHFVRQGGADAIVDSHYYPGRNADNFIPTLVADDHFLHPSYDIPLYYSGGNFQASQDRQGFVTSLIFTDNPDLSEPDVAALYQEYQGVDTLHVFSQLPTSVDGTGHIDMWLYLVDEDTVIISEFLPGENPEAIEITDNAVPYMEGLGYEVFRTPAFNAVHPGQGNTHYTYTNAFRVNDRIFIPSYGQGDPSYQTYDDQALAAWQQAAGPGVEIVPIDSYPIIWAAGAIHCIVKQVPRHVPDLPSACVTSPAGGERLVPNTVHEITWTASDDGAVDSVDLRYSTDGGATFPGVIASGLPDTGSYPWSVPELESETARVRVVARDDGANETSADGDGDFVIESALQRVYDFSTGAGVEHRAYGSETASWSDLDGVRRPASVSTELTAAQYAALAVSDATGGPSDPGRYVAPQPFLFDESTHLFEFTIAEDPADVVDVAVSWEGFAQDCAQVELYVWDTIAGQWSDTRGGFGRNRHLDNFAGNRDGRLRGHIRSDFGRYIAPDGTFTLLLYAERGFNRTYHDHVSVTVTHEACDGPDLDFDGFADACDNCTSVVNVDQANADGDARGDACDCAVDDPGAFATPGEIGGVGFDDPTTLSWESDAARSGSGTTYDVVRGEVGGYPVGGGGETCAADGLPSTSLGGIVDPAPGTGHTYLVRGTNVCGVSSYGTASDGTTRDSATCP